MYSSFWTTLDTEARSPMRIAFTDGKDDRVREAAARLKAQNIEACFVSAETEIKNNSALKLHLQARLMKNQIPDADAQACLSDPLYVGMAMLATGSVAGLVGGASRPTADVVRAALRCIGAKPAVKLISGHFLLESVDRHADNGTPFLLADCAVVPEPSSRVLAHTATQAAHSYEFFTGQKARVAFLSFSTRGSATHELVDRIREAVEMVRKASPTIAVDGELQADAALDVHVAQIKQADPSDVAGHANVLIFPTLEAGNIGYKLIQRFSRTRVAGPLLWGLAKPASDLSRGCTVDEVVDSALCVAKMARSLN
jgi:phosphate acetyltransferase